MRPISTVSDTPASAAVLPYMEHAFGMWYVRGGMRELARAVYERCLARRVEFRFGAEAAGVVEKDGRAAGLELADGTVAEADFVVAGVAPGVLDRLSRGTRTGTGARPRGRSRGPVGGVDRAGAGRPSGSVGA